MIRVIWIIMLVLFSPVVIFIMGLVKLVELMKWDLGLKEEKDE